jgi:hypothetical protein
MRRNFAPCESAVLVDGNNHSDKAINSQPNLHDYFWSLLLFQITTGGYQFPNGMSFFEHPLPLRKAHFFHSKGEVGSEVDKVGKFGRGGGAVSMHGAVFAPLCFSGHHF